MTPRSYLYVPGDRPDRFAKAAGSGADAVILDLEDAVPVAAKHDARRAVAAFLARARTPAGDAPAVELWVRVDGGAGLDTDLAALPEAASPFGVLVAKATLAAVTRATSAVPRVAALVETAEGLCGAAAIAALPGVTHLAIGEADLCAELGVDPSAEHALWPLRMAIVVAAARAGLVPPTAPVSTDFADLDALRASTDALRRAGFGARACIHPRQVAVVNDVFTPSAEDVDAAAALLAAAEAAAAAGRGVFVDADGRMVDEAVLRRARQLLDRAP